MEIQILKQTVTAKSRTLNVGWRLVYSRLDMPDNLDLSLFPHVVHVNNHEQAQAWCATHVGDVDHAWTYSDSEAILFKDLEHATQFRLSL